MDRQILSGLASRLSDATTAETTGARETDSAAAEHVSHLLAQAVLSVEGSCSDNDSAAKASCPCWVFQAGLQQLDC